MVKMKLKPDDVVSSRSRRWPDSHALFQVAFNLGLVTNF